MRSRLLAFVRLFAALSLAALVLVLPALARAGGTVTITDLQPKEDNGKWKLKMTMNYGATPPTAHIPMLFSFTPTVLYERTLTDKSPNTPVLTKLPLSNQQAIPASMDVGFGDGTGKVFAITKFDFVINRDQGFEAGEYTLVIKRSNDGVQMGSQMRIVLQGDNPIVDRRAIVFSGEKKDKPKADAPASGDPKSDAPSGDPPPSEPPPEAPSEAPVESPPPVEPKQGGCGCRVAAAGAPSPLPLLAAAGALAFAVRRRRRRA